MPDDGPSDDLDVPKDPLANLDRDFDPHLMRELFRSEVIAAGDASREVG